MEPILSKLSADAQRFLSLLDSLDYLPSPIKKLLLSDLMCQHEESGIIELQELKKRAAIVLFDHNDMLSAQAKIYLKKDWTLLFGP